MANDNLPQWDRGWIVRGSMRGMGFELPALRKREDAMQAFKGLRSLCPVITVAYVQWVTDEFCDEAAND